MIAVCMAAISAAAGAQEIKITGSTTLLPVAQKTAEIFMKKNPGIRITVGGGGSGVGIASLVDGTCDIANSSRAMKSKERQSALSRKVNPKANVVALDAIALVVNSSNRIEGLTRQQVKDIYSGKISNWSQVGGNNLRIVVVSRDSASGTFEAFNELALGGARVRKDALMQASNQAVATIVSQAPGAIGYVGLGYISGSVRAVPVGGVKPSRKTVLSKSYGYSRSLFMYTNGEPRGAVKKYIDFVTGKEGQKIVEEVGFVGID